MQSVSVVVCENVNSWRAYTNIMVRMCDDLSSEGFSKAVAAVCFSGASVVFACDVLSDGVLLCACYGVGDGGDDDDDGGGTFIR